MSDTVRAIPGLLDAIAQAMYETHKPKFNPHMVPPWEQASDPIREYVRKQARSVTDVVDLHRAVTPIQDHPALLEELAQAIYRTHGRNLPNWKQVTEELREWHRQQALSVARVLDDTIAKDGKE